MAEPELHAIKYISCVLSHSQAHHSSSCEMYPVDCSRCGERVSHRHQLADHLLHSCRLEECHICNSLVGLLPTCTHLPSLFGNLSMFYKILRNKMQVCGWASYLSLLWALSICLRNCLSLRLRVRVPPTHVCAYRRPYKCMRNAVQNFHVNF